LIIIILLIYVNPDAYIYILHIHLTEDLQNSGVIQECRKGTHFFIGAKEL